MSDTSETERKHSMKQAGSASWVGNGLVAVIGIGLAVACGTSGGGGGEPFATSTRTFVNGGFESGAAGVAPQSWTVSTNTNPNAGVTIQTPQTYAGLGLAAGGVPLTVTLSSPTGPLTQTDPLIGAGASLRWPRFGNQCAIVNKAGANHNVNTMSQTMTVGAGDVDPVDNQVHIRFVVAPVLENPGHLANQQPYFFVQATNLTRANAILYSNFNFSNQSGVPWKAITVGGNAFTYTDWQLIDIAPGSPAINQGDMVRLDVIAAGCSLGAHLGQVYVDGIGGGTTLPGLFVSAKTAPQVNACSNLTYTLAYENGAATAAAGVTLTFNTPPGTTFQSIAAPGLVCTTPAIGGTGAVNCTVGNVAAGAGGSLQVTVNVACASTGTVVAGNYSIQGTGIEALLGPVVTTTIGCTLDAQCPAGDWCDESANACTATLANGTALPVDGPHTNPTLNGTCTAAAGTLVCTSQVCDTDSRCGYANGDGACTAGPVAPVCRSGVCDPDGKCGYANGHGACASGAVCRSGACSVSGVCEPAGGCAVDADCASTQYCNTPAAACVTKVPNGQPVPTVAGHSPALTGACTVAAGTAACASAVCDTKDSDCGYANSDGPCTVANQATVCRSAVCDTNDLQCGYANGDGPCTTGTAGVVCRSGACSTTGKCEPAGGCNVDADCPQGDWCNETAHACSAKLTNGTAMPTDAPHTSPTLDGTCSTAAATLVCQALVCDTKDGKCGYANGDGQCTTGTASTVCRSGTCSATGGVCIPAGGCAVDADCTQAQFCDTSMEACVPKLVNGTSVPTISGHTPALTGMCSTTVGAAVCVSGVCDTTDSKCGYANGDGPCTTGTATTVCRSGLCSSAGTCEPAGGCNTDADCATGTWCNETAHMCASTLTNGTPLPTDGAHVTPTLNGTCTAAAAALVCQSGVCDPKDNACGYENGEGPCTAADGPTDCRSTVCATAGANQGLCVACVMDSQCSGSTPACNTTTNTCVQCTSSTMCPSETPVCDTATGQCGTQCTSDADCSTSEWCNAAPGATGTCVAKLPNGTKLPSAPATVTTCTATVGARVCASGACDPRSNACGFTLGDGPCTSDAQCIGGACDPASSTCVATDGGTDGATGCQVDSQCGAGKYCASGSCAPTLPTGSACDRPAECQSADCSGKVCSQLVSSGSGVLCAVRAPGGASDARGGEGPAGLLLVVAAVAIRRRRRRDDPAAA